MNYLTYIELEKIPYPNARLTLINENKKVKLKNLLPSCLLVSSFIWLKLPRQGAKHLPNRQTNYCMKEM